MNGTAKSLIGEGRPFVGGWVAELTNDSSILQRVAILVSFSVSGEDSRTGRRGDLILSLIINQIDAQNFVLQ